jgi:hypothetical protein
MTETVSMTQTTARLMAQKNRISRSSTKCDRIGSERIVGNKKPASNS